MLFSKKCKLDLDDGEIVRDEISALSVIEMKVRKVHHEFYCSNVPIQ